MVVVVVGGRGVGRRREGGGGGQRENDLRISKGRRFAVTTTERKIKVYTEVYVDVGRGAREVRGWGYA